jgi:predicted aspartyl protease
MPTELHFPKFFRDSFLVAIGMLGLFLCGSAPALGLGVSCPVLHPGPPTDADKALLAAHFDQAATLFAAEVAARPTDPEAVGGLVHSLLRQQKVKEAADAVNAALSKAPTSVALMTLRGEVELREGAPWDAAKTANEAVKADPCNPRVRLLMAHVAEIGSLYATARAHILTAHRLDPEDLEIREQWIGTLPAKQRISEIEAYLAAPTGDDPEDVRHLQMYLDFLKKQAEEPHKSCHLVSQTSSAEVPFAPLMRDGTHVRAYGLDVKLNDHTARLQIDTGAGGLLISRSVAEHAGLKALSRTEVGGIGDQGAKGGYTAYADSIRIGNMEFADCPVRVLDSRNVMDDSDGLIGMDVFAQFLVTLDYPMRKLLLGPLPPRPGEVATKAPVLKTGNGDAGDEGDESTSGAADKAAAPAESQAAKPVNHGPYDRYVAPEMKDYTEVYRVGHDLILPASLNDKAIKLFIMDTGAFATTVSPQAAREVSKVHSDDMKVHGLSGEVNKVFTTDDITFKFAHLSQRAYGVYAFDTSHISKSTGMEISGFLGANTLKMLTIHIDYRDGLVKFDYVPNRGFRN